MFFLGLIFFKPLSKTLIAFFILFEILSCLLDYNRWQPWEYQYLLTFYIFLFSNNKTQIIKLISILICFTYIFSGLHKLNGGFIYLIWESMILGKLLHFNFDSHNIIIHYFGLFIPIIEIILGIGILIFTKKKYFILGLIIMHLLIIYFLCPIGLNYNLIVIPWNLLMLLLIIILFHNTNMNFIKNFQPFYKFDFVIIILVCLLPILNFFSLWDDYLSFNLYSGNNQTMVVEVERIEQIPELKKHSSSNKIYKILKNSTPIYINSMAMSEIKVPLYSEKRTFKIFKKQWDKKYPQLKKRFFVFRYPYSKQAVYEIQ